jgi:hypothetical protein
VQKTDDFVSNLEMLEGCDARSVAMAVEYRGVANQMLRFSAAFSPSNADYEELVRYFDCWLEALGVPEERYRELAALL